MRVSKTKLHSHFSFVTTSILHSSGARMDASSLASAALALGVANSQTAALQELLLERERLAMGAEDLRSFFVAARHFTRDLLLQRGSVPAADVPWT